MGELLSPDIAGAEKTLSQINSPGKKETEEVMELLSVKPPPGGASPEKNADAGNGTPELFYFFSFSMPRSSLREAAQESAAGGAVMVLRGLSGETLGETASRISGVIGKSGAEVWIDPVLFECLAVGGGTAACACLRLPARYGVRGSSPHKGFWGHISSLRSRANGKGGRKCRDVY